jgi:hypothetical protein
MSGAIWTTDSKGEQVNGNLFANPRDVYLSGGPDKIGGNGLPDGDYYFQVTDTSGNLLSSDNISFRRFTVSNGYITGSYNHKSNVVDDGITPPRIVVQLWTFGYTPKKGGECKVWVTGVSNYQEGQGVSGFIPSMCKTDNFKVGRLDEVPKYFELGVTDGILELDNLAFYVNYSIEVGEAPGAWTTGQLIQEQTLEVFRHEATFAIGTNIYWEFFVSNVTAGTILWTSGIQGPELISEAGMVNNENLFLIDGHQYDNRPTDNPTALDPVAGSTILLLVDGETAAQTQTDLSGYYEIIASAPSTLSCGEAWYELTVDSAFDQTLDFFNDVTYMTGLDTGLFTVIFTPSNDGTDTYKLSSTNPGSFHFNVEETGVSGSPACINITLPPAEANAPYDSPNFLLHHTYIGGILVVDIHVYDGGTADITDSFTISSSADGKLATVCGTMPDSGSIVVTAHIDYQISGSLTSDEAQSFSATPFTYTFTVTMNARIFGVHQIFGIH